MRRSDQRMKLSARRLGAFAFGGRILGWEFARRGLSTIR